MAHCHYCGIDQGFELSTEKSLSRADSATITALASNMQLAPSNDVRDTEHWLREHVELVGLAAAVEWYARCAVSRDRDPFSRQLDWKQGIYQTRVDARPR